MVNRQLYKDSCRERCRVVNYLYYVGYRIVNSIRSAPDCCRVASGSCNIIDWCVKYCKTVHFFIASLIKVENKIYQDEHCQHWNICRFVWFKKWLNRLFQECVTNKIHFSTCPTLRSIMLWKRIPTDIVINCATVMYLQPSELNYVYVCSRLHCLKMYNC
jgi:hypothetical protein